MSNKNQNMRMKREREGKTNLPDDLPGVGWTFLDLADKGEPASANLQTAVSVQITRMLQDFEGFSDFPSLLLLFSCDN